MSLEAIVPDIADALKAIDCARVPFKNFQPGVGPYGEPQLVKLLAEHLNRIPRYRGNATTMRTPDLLIAVLWAIEIKIARPFGDNGRLAENWSVNLLHPYSGNTSLLGDCLKLQSYACREQKGAVVIGYEHDPPQITLEPLIRSFELIARDILSVRLGERVTAMRTGLIHPVHQRVIVIGWNVT